MNEINNPSRLKKLKINFPKFSMKSAENVDLSDIDLEKLAQKPVKKRKENYPATSYKTVKEFFYRSAKEFTSKTAIAAIEKAGGKFVKTATPMRARAEGSRKATAEDKK